MGLGPSLSIRQSQQLVLTPQLRQAIQLLQLSNLELDALKQAEDVSDISIRETVKDVEKLSELLKGAYPVYHLAKPEEKERIICIS